MKRRTPSIIETELKLRFESKDRLALLRHPLLRKTRFERRQLHAIYFDSIDLRLARAGLTFRQRTIAGKKTEITVKAEGRAAAGLNARPEWTAFSEQASIAVLPKAARKKIDMALQGETMRPVFEVSVERRQTKMHYEGAEIELALDSGQVKAGRRKLSLCEMELELISGKPDALFSLAKQLNTAVPLIAETQTKAQRGYALAGLEQKDRRPDPIELKPNDAPSDAFVHILATSLQWLLHYEGVARRGDRVTAVHQIRVSLRRLRAALRLFHSAAPTAELEELLIATRRLAQAMAAARDLDVFAQDILPGLNLSPSSRRLITKRLQLVRPRAEKLALQALAHRDCAALLLDLGTCMIRPPDFDEKKLINLTSRALAKQHKKTIKRGRKIESLSNEALHDLRIAVKKLRYALDFFHSLYTPDQIQPMARVLQKIQHQLGAINDAVTAKEILVQLRPPKPGTAWQKAEREAFDILMAQVQTDRKKIVKAWKQFAGLKPFW